MRRLRNTTLNRTTYVKACNIKVKFELTEIGAEIKKKLLIHKMAPQGVNGTYSERMIPELNISFAKIVP